MCVSRKGSRPRPGSLQIHPGAQDTPTRGCCNSCCALWLGAKIHPSLHPASRLLRGGARCSPCHACPVGGEELARRIAPLGKDVSGRNVDVLSHQWRRTTVNAIVAVVHAMCTRIVPRSAGELCLGGPQAPTTQRGQLGYRSKVQEACGEHEVYCRSPQAPHVFTAHCRGASAPRWDGIGYAASWRSVAQQPVGHNNQLDVPGSSVDVRT